MISGDRHSVLRLKTDERFHFSGACRLRGAEFETSSPLRIAKGELRLPPAMRSKRVVQEVQAILLGAEPGIVETFTVAVRGVTEAHAERL